jgi:hypothetical protein
MGFTSYFCLSIAAELLAGEITIVVVFTGKGPHLEHANNNPNA